MPEFPPILTFRSGLDRANARATVARVRYWTAAVVILAGGVVGLSAVRGERGEGPVVSSAADVSDARVSCHQMPTGLSHPVGVTPSMAVPAGLPLDAGRVSCTTCHDEQAAAGHASRGSREIGRAHV